MKSKRRKGGAPMQPEQKQSIYITSQANSCNNQVSKYSVLGNYADPSITKYGIFSMLRHNPEHIVDQPTYQVYVSCCVSSWMTAILLYGRKCTTLKLVVAPFLKEDGFTPAPIDVQRKKMDKFKQFLVEIDRTHADSITVQLNSTNACKILQCKVTVVLPYAEGALYEWNTPVASSCNSEELKYSTYPNAVDVPMFKVSYSYENKLSRNSIHPEDNTTYAPEMTKYFPGGIERFCSWVPLETVYAVAHSKLMNQSVLSFGVNLPKSVSNGDAWTLGFQKNNSNQTMQITQYSAGVPSQKGNLDEMCSDDKTVGQQLYQSILAAPKLAFRQSAEKKVSSKSPFSAARQWFNQTFARKKTMTETEFQQNGDALILKPKGSDSITFGGRSKRGKKRRTQRKR